MSRVAYVNGRYAPQRDPAVEVEDRGFQFADGIYEVWAIAGGGLIDEAAHFARLERSLRELAIPRPMSDAALRRAARETLRRNRVRDGILYLQITRGAAPRDHAFPAAATPPTVVMTAKSIPPRSIEARANAGVSVISTPETRWARCDIKSVSLLPNVLAKQAARAAGAFEAWFVDADGLVTEGSSSNAWIVSQTGALVTRDLNANILQIENEYYSFIRPKRVTQPGESPSAALARAGVEYVEVRALDVSAFDPVGVNQNKLRFLEAFLALCLLRDGPPIDAGEQDALDANHLAVARRGREPGLKLMRDGRQVSMVAWARELLDQMTGLCELLDAGDPARPYGHALQAQVEKLDDVSRTPSARLLRELRDTGETFYELGLRMSAAHKAYFLDLHAPNPGRLAELAGEAAESHVKQAALERAQAGESFDAYLARVTGRSD